MRARRIMQSENAKPFAAHDPRKSLYWPAIRKALEELEENKELNAPGPARPL